MGIDRLPIYTPLTVVQILNISTEFVASTERHKGSFECNVCGRILTGHYGFLRHRQSSNCKGLQARITSGFTAPVDAPIVVIKRV